MTLGKSGSTKKVGEAIRASVRINLAPLRLPAVPLLLAVMSLIFSSQRAMAAFSPDKLRQDFIAAKREDAVRCLDFLSANMSAEDRTNGAITTNLVCENIDFALRARNEYSWCRQLPEKIFLNEVLPYAVADETRDPWRREFYEKFSPVVKDCTNAAAAVRSIQQHIVTVTGVNYNTKRRAPNQSPSESMASGMASCTGLSILLVDACRAVGIPARLAGVLTWPDGSGNHNWVEVWVDGCWHFTEYYPDKNGFDHGWLLDRLTGVTGNDPATAVWVSSWEKTGQWFPLVWRMKPDSVQYSDIFAHVLPAVNVTGHYLELARRQHPVVFGLPVQVTVLDTDGHRIASHVRVISRKDGKETFLAEGDSPSAQDDLNHHLEFVLPPGTQAEVTAQAANGRASAKLELPANAPAKGEKPVVTKLDLKLAP
jgi:transglutaminase-like putative cysteine protease